VARYLWPRRPNYLAVKVRIFSSRAHAARLETRPSSIPNLVSMGAPPVPAPLTDGLQLREKQKVKRMYGVLERQFRSLL